MLCDRDDIYSTKNKKIISLFLRSALICCCKTTSLKFPPIGGHSLGDKQATALAIWSPGEFPNISYLVSGSMYISIDIVCQTMDLLFYNSQFK